MYSIDDSSTPEETVANGKDDIHPEQEIDTGERKSTEAALTPQDPRNGEEVICTNSASSDNPDTGLDVDDLNID